MPLPDMPECCWDRYATFPAPGAQGNEAKAIEEGRFTFLNREETLGWPPADWDVPGLPKLWQYNLHYSEWLWALGYPAARTAILDWIERHPLEKSRVGWEPYPTSLRIMNWCGVCFAKFRGRSREDHDFKRALWGSVYLQAEWLSRNLETHLLGNHLLENGAALAFVGSCFGQQAWLSKGMEILREQLPEQILSDGMHFERSPMYHSRVTYLLTLLSNTKHEALKQIVDDPLVRAREALARLCHPDGEIALFNDSAFRIYNPPRDLLGNASKQALGAWALPDAGYYGWRGADGSYLICDAGPIGPDYLPGHAHGDMFSFELSLKGHRVIVDSGVYDYVPGEMRSYCRSTRAHNTVEIDGQDQCEFWGAFRVARRGYPCNVQWGPAPDGFRLGAEHDGYRRLPGKPIHHRTFLWDGSGCLEITDRIQANRVITAVSRLHLDPACRITSMDKGEVRVEYPEGKFRISIGASGTFRQEESLYCPEFGRKEPNVAVAVTLKGKEIETKLSVVSS
ncbi:MAG: alginate lyase family protein [FCB group bacterium]|nr:alginate lyase family protein [FCB group bacterium]